MKIDPDLIDVHVLGVCSRCAKHGRFGGESVCSARQDDPGDWMDDKAGWWQCRAVLEEVGLVKVGRFVTRCAEFEDKPKRKTKKAEAKDAEERA